MATIFNIAPWIVVVVVFILQVNGACLRCGQNSPDNYYASTKQTSTNVCSQGNNACSGHKDIESKPCKYTSLSKGYGNWDFQKGYYDTKHNYQCGKQECSCNDQRSNQGKPSCIEFEQYKQYLLDYYEKLLSYTLACKSHNDDPIIKPAQASSETNSTTTQKPTTTTQKSVATTPQPTTTTKKSVATTPQPTTTTTTTKKSVATPTTSAPSGPVDSRMYRESFMKYSDPWTYPVIPRRTYPVIPRLRDIKNLIHTDQNTF